MKYKIGLCSSHVFSNTEKRALYEYFGDFESIYRASKDQLLSLEFLTPEKVLEFCSEKSKTNLEEMCSYMEKEKIFCISCFDEEFPEKLKHIHDVPFQLFYKGDLPGKNERIVAVVGARMCSGYGKSKTLELCELLGNNGFSVVSGMAMGIDSYAHEGALNANGKTYAVLGCGVDVCYPSKNQSLYKQIINTGCVMSEFAPKVHPQPEFFPRRNRIISGMADAVILIEAKERSGSLITANLALEQGKDIFALPGRISDPLSYGTNKIISQGAGIIVSFEKLVDDIKDLTDFHYIPAVFPPKKKFNLEKEELLVYSCFDFNSKSIEEVASETKMDILTVLQIVLHLCEYNLIEETFMNQYIKV